MRYALAGDREISCAILKFMIGSGYNPEALFVTEGATSSHAKQLIDISNLEKDFIFSGKDFQKDSSISVLKELELDYIFGIHFPYIIPAAVLDIPKIGFLNLHPAFLPFNKGWHTPSWAILDKTPYGATLHFMSDKLDEGDIIHQKILPITVKDTANSLYEKVLSLEKEVFFEAFEDLLSKTPNRTIQSEVGSVHNKKDLKGVQQIDLEKKIRPLQLIDKLRALTTNNKSEAAFFEVEGRKIGVRVELFEKQNN